jgi:ABC-type multidrug transport system fused ATPase/permease subunit
MCTFRALKRLHEQMIDKVLYAPVNLYFDVTPVGRIMTKFSDNLNVLSNSFGLMLGGSMAYFNQMIQVFIIAILAVKWVGVFLPLLLLISFVLV